VTPLFFVFLWKELIMIDHVRRTVLSVLNKENRGTLTVSQFNSYAKHAQQLLFDQYFSEYARLNTMKNARRLSRDQGDKLAILRSNIDKFMKTTSQGITNTYVQKPTDLYTPISLVYSGKIMEYVPKHKETYLESSNIAGPSALYPGYCDENDKWYVKPSTLTGEVDINYIRTLADPNWTYTVVGENVLHNPSATDFQDFELGPDDMTSLVIEILKLSGVTIREAEVAQAAAQIDAVETQKENT
jgi:hypothetical protein